MVISLIILLVALLLPALNRARDQTRIAMCKANMRQWAQGVRSYANDNDNAFPDNRWFANPASAPYENYRNGFHMSWNSSVVEQMWAEYMMGNATNWKKKAASVLNCPTQQWHRDNDVAVTGGLVGYFYLPGRNQDNVTNYTYAGQDWFFRPRFDGPAANAPILVDMKQYHSGNMSWFYATAPFSSHTRPDGEPYGCNFLFEDGSVTWSDSDTGHNPVHTDPDDIIQLGATIGAWWTYCKIPL